MIICLELKKKTVIRVVLQKLAENTKFNVYCDQLVFVCTRYKVTFINAYILLTNITVKRNCHNTVGMSEKIKQRRDDLDLIHRLLVNISHYMVHVPTPVSFL